MLWLLTGEINSGKSRWVRMLVTLLRNDLSLKIGGIITHAVFERNRKSGYVCEDLLSGGERPFALLQARPTGPSDFVCGRWLILGTGLEFARTALERSFQESPDIIVVDEFGILEIEGKGFRRNVDNLARSGSDLFIIVRTSLVNEAQSIYKDSTPAVVQINTQTLNQQVARESDIYKWYASAKRKR